MGIIKEFKKFREYKEFKTMPNYGKTMTYHREALRNAETISSCQEIWVM